LTEGRYLLFRALDDSVAVFDGWNMTEYQAEFIAKHRGILLVDIVLVYCRTHAVAAAAAPKMLITRTRRVLKEKRMRRDIGKKLRIRIK
jgi:hypothetical protein